ncbi:MAG: hypothetical protein ABIG84_07485 [archaeon]
MYVPILNYFIDVEEAIVVLCIVIVAYLAVMHIEFKQLKIISKKFSKEDDDFAKCIRELKNDVSALNDLVRTKEIRTISSHVSGNVARQKVKGSKDKESREDKSNASPAPDGSEDLGRENNGSSVKDTKSLKDMLDKV